MQLVVSAFGQMEEQKDLNKTEGLDLTCHHIIHRIFSLAHRSLSRKLGSKRVACVYSLEEVVRQDMFQQEVEPMTVVMVAEMT